MLNEIYEVVYLGELYSFSFLFNYIWHYYNVCLQKEGDVQHSF